MDTELVGKTALVTGAGQGIGLAITRALVAEGARVVAAARRRSAELEALAAAGPVVALELDLTEPDAPQRMLDAAGGRVHVLVNNVGLARTRTGGFLSVTDEQWRETLDVNLMTAVRMCRATLPLMLAAGGGVIVSTGSANAVLPDPGVVDYGAAKAALSNLAKALSKEFGTRGVRVNTVAPGPVGTDLWLGPDGVAQTVSRASGKSPQSVQAEAVAGSATRRFTTPQEVADLVVFLAGERAGNLTGASIAVDGGLVTTL
ncbi:SDR family NAD(P)-dependent oxidoreductase [Kineosporia succinea]|uniref:NAD(P)-dependent dehydrogenase (Short-subunit alcohol dehydrogenase family) n=1 Tax=Kineosporia succinea TaxID=84632 RepID=A0ABT9PAG7_9ACTN|nr:SDR family oxidoreductase [Kineosporia succinea]MDP9829040.1 NAD(P)-dependent dehydrogenase (short-subunit alcohol dehydrogenase family) [Kineosporia succinea]